jgi:hypothetical protein
MGQRRIPRGLYEESLESYESLRPVLVNRRYAVYDLSESDWLHLLYMARCHLEAQVTGASDENDHVTLCKRYLKQLARIEGERHESH